MNEQERHALESYLKPSAIDQYEKWIDTLGSYFVQCNLHIFYVERIEAFNKKLFPLNIGGQFWQTTFNAHFYMAIIRLFSLAGEKDSDDVCLRTFRNFIKEHCINDEIRSNLTSEVGERLNTWSENIRETLNIARNKFGAHLNSYYHSLSNPSSQAQKPITITPIKSKTLRTIFREAEEFWSKMQFGADRPFSPFWYPKPLTDTSEQTDIDDLLDYTAFTTSPLVKTMQMVPTLFESMQGQYDEHERAEINRLLANFGFEYDWPKTEQNDT